LSKNTAADPEGEEPKPIPLMVKTFVEGSSKAPAFTVAGLKLLIVGAVILVARFCSRSIERFLIVRYLWPVWDSIVW